MSSAHSQAHIVTSVFAFESHFAKHKRTHLMFSETLPPARIPSHCRVTDDDSHSKMFYFVISKMLVCRVSDLHSTALA